MSSLPLLKKLSMLALQVGAASTLQATQPANTQNAGAQRAPAITAPFDRHAFEREQLVTTYAPLNADFEGMFPALYDDHGEIAGPGGVHLDPKTVLTCQKLTPLNPNIPVTVISYKKAIRDELDEMAAGRLPQRLKGIYALEEVTITVGDLNIKDLPKQGVKTHPKAVYLMSLADRNKYHLQAVREHLQRVEKSFGGADNFYSMPFLIQAVALDLGYTRGLENMKCGRALLQMNLDAPSPEIPGKTNRQVLFDEAYTSSKEHNARRHRIRQFFTDKKSLFAELPEEDQKNDRSALIAVLGPGEIHLIDLAIAVADVAAEREASQPKQPLQIRGSNGFTK